MSNNELNTYYEILGLQPGASILEIKQAYRNLVKTEHPDLFTHDPELKQRAEEKFKKVTEAYERLKESYYSNYLNRDANSSTNTTSSNTNTNPTNTNTNPTNTNTTSTPPNTAASPSRNNNSLLSNLRPHLRRLLPIVVGVNIINLGVLAYLKLNNSKSQNSSSHQISLSPQNSSSPQNSPSPQIASSSIQPQQCRIVEPTIGNSARLFSQPIRDTYAGKRIPQNTKVAFIGGMGEFVEVELPDKSRGWMFNDQIYPCSISSNSRNQMASVSMRLQQCLIIAPKVGKGARMFTQPSKDTYIGKRIPQATNVTLIGAQREFLQVKLRDNTQFWVFNDQVYPCAPGSNSSPKIVSNSAQPQQCRVVEPTIGNSARLFSQPSKDAYIGKRIPQNTKVSFIGGKGAFVEVELPDKSRGWMFNDQIHPCRMQSNSHAQIAAVPPVQSQQCLVIAPTAGRGARLFTQPSKDTFTGRRLPQNTNATLIREQREFAEIRLADGTQGWVFNDQVHPCNGQ